MDYIALDLETSGLSPEKSYILEIGAIKVIDGNIKDTFETFVQCSVPIEERVKELTGITDEMVQTGKCEEQAITELMEFVGDYPLLGHNISFDYGFIKATSLRCGIAYEAEAIDTLKIARRVLPELEKKTLEYLCSYYNIETKTSHRALEDARAAMELYKRLKEQFGAQEELFLPEKMKVKIKKQEPVTNAQKRYLQDLMNYHQLNQQISIDKLSKSEASRKIDEIIREFGRIQRFR